MESRHVDVLEMDAASHTGIDDVRQIIDGIRYSPVIGAIQGLHHRRGSHALREGVQRLPEDAGRASAAREIHLRHHRDPQGPCHHPVALPALRLRRIEADKLVAHLGRICASEGVQADDEALAAIARAAEGSARDSLSLMDQAIAHGAGVVTGETVRDMLGLADRTQVIDLFEAIMRGDVPAAFAGPCARNTMPAPIRR